MKVHLYTRCWNDAEMLPFFFRHYDRFVSRYFIFDDGSTDDSVALIKSHPRAVLCPMPPRADPNSRVASGLALLENSWTLSRGRADWVVVTDIDEHIHHPNIRNYLFRCKRAGITIIPGIGYNMLSDAFPPPGVWLMRQVFTGAPAPNFNKMNLFDPNAITATNFTPGRHRAAPEGRVVAPARDELLLLHFRYLGFDRTYRRHQEYLGRQKPGDLERRWGWQYSLSRDELREVWKKTRRNAVDLREAGAEVAVPHGGMRWWSDYERAEPCNTLLDRVHGLLTAWQT